VLEHEPGVCRPVRNVYYGYAAPGTRGYFGFPSIISCTTVTKEYAMLATKRYEYLATDRISVHPTISNHRQLNTAKVTHLSDDIVKNGLLEPLVVWERSQGEYYLVGGFHRMAAIREIRKKNPGYFDRVDVRVVAGDPDEIKALNLKLNADRLDTKVTDYFETVLHLNNVNWSRERIAEFLDKSTSWIDEIIRYAPMITPKMRTMLESGELSWNRAKEILQKTLKAPAGNEKAILEQELATPVQRKPLTFKSVIGHFGHIMEAQPTRRITLNIQDLYSLIIALHGKNCNDEHLARVKTVFPELINN
jgi:ParB family transcriptional regulator, chromosome partitioning protein